MSNHDHGTGDSPSNIKSGLASKIAPQLVNHPMSKIKRLDKSPPSPPSPLIDFEDGSLLDLKQKLECLWLPLTLKITKCFLESVLVIAMIVLVKLLDGGDDETDENGNKSSLSLFGINLFSRRKVCFEHWTLNAVNLIMESSSLQNLECYPNHIIWSCL